MGGARRFFDPARAPQIASAWLIAGRRLSSTCRRYSIPGQVPGDSPPEQALAVEQIVFALGTEPDNAAESLVS